MHYTERKAAKRPSSQITSISAAFSQISGVKGASSLWICNYFIKYNKYNISPAAHSCQVQRKFGMMASGLAHVHTPHTHTPPYTTHTGSALAHSPAVPVWPRGWLITGTSSISEIMGGLSHAVSASGHTCNQALPIFFLTLKIPTQMKFEWLQAPKNSITTVCSTLLCRVCWRFSLSTH